MRSAARAVGRALTQFDYLHLATLVGRSARRHRRAASPARRRARRLVRLAAVRRPAPARARAASASTSRAIPYGVADVVSDEFLPFADASFDLVMCVQSFHYMRDPAAAVAEMARVLRPGGSALVSSVLGYEYDRRHFEARYTEHQLRGLFDGWDDVRVREDGGRTVSWTVLTGIARERPRAAALVAAGRTAASARVHRLVRGRELGGARALPARAARRLVRAAR